MTYKEKRKPHNQTAPEKRCKNKTQPATQAEILQDKNVFSHTKKKQKPNNQASKRTPTTQKY
jgi:hypothetical protein